jgi:tRNA modification GTPase
VRLSGPGALSIARRLSGIEPAARRAHLCVFRDSGGERIDEGLMLFFPQPRSYTGEDVIELHGHGGSVVSDWLLRSALELGARAAEPGEFTLRAFLNDKLDLTQAEAIADLIDSGSCAAARAAGRSLSGQFRQHVDALQAALTDLRVQVEAWLDFPDEELELEAVAALAERLHSALERGRALRARAAEGRVLRDGLAIVIAGPPNAGKSSLLNRLVGYEAAIVTQIPGTTRDPLREHLSIDGLPIEVVDTAGLRDALDPVEKEGVRRARREMGRADRVLWVTDVRDDLAAAIAAARAKAGPARGLTVIQNKVDLTDMRSGRFDRDDVAIIRLSALTGEGLELVRKHLKDAAGYGGEVAGTFSARRRHLDALQRAEDSLARAHAHTSDAATLELGAEELRAAQQALGELTGELTSDDLLGEIFSSFCIGK